MTRRSTASCPTIRRQGASSLNRLFHQHAADHRGAGRRAKDLAGADRDAEERAGQILRYAWQWQHDPYPGNLLSSQRIGAEALHVPYRGSAPGMLDTLAGRHAFQIDTLGTSKGFIDGGKLRILAVMRRQASEPSCQMCRQSRRAPGFQDGGHHLVSDVGAGRDAAADHRQAQHLQSTRRSVGRPSSTRPRRSAWRWCNRRRPRRRSSMKSRWPTGRRSRKRRAPRWNRSNP